MKSMTGFGRGVATEGDVRATVDVRAVNHRYLDLKLRGAAIAPALEDAIGQRVRGALERGAVTVTVHVGGAPGGGAGAPAIDQAAAERAHRELTALAARLGTPPPDLALVLAQPGVVTAGERDGAGAAGEEAPVLPALDTALAQLAAMRAAEGQALAAELTARLDELAALRAQLAALASGVAAVLARRLHERVRRLVDDAELDPARLAQEVALLADRADVTEELVRLGSHLEQARALVTGPAGGARGAGGVGRRLDFLVQEIGRELNTIGSKAAQTEITAAVVEGKAVLEKVREQVQNVE